MVATEQPQPSAGRAREIAKRLFKNEDAVRIIILVVLILVTAIVTKGRSIAPKNVRNIIMETSIRGVAAIGQLFVILTGGIDLSVGGLALMAVILGSSMMTNRAANLILSAPASPTIVIPVMIIVALGVGAINGLSVSRLRMPPIIVTLAMWQITLGLAYQICQGSQIRGLPPSLNFIGQRTIVGAPVLIVVFVLVAVIAYFVLNYTTFGHSVYAVGGNPVASWLSGIKVQNILLSAYIISGFSAALAGLMILSRVMSASMLAIKGLELDAIAAVFIGGASLAGGRGTVVGVVVGSLMLGFVSNGLIMMGVNPLIQDQVTGAIIFTSVAIDVWRHR